MRWIRLQKKNTTHDSEKKNGTLGKTFQILLFYLTIIVVWQLVYIIFVDVLGVWKPYIMPSPLKIADKGAELLTDLTFYAAIGSSMWRIIRGYVISVVIGTLIGTAMMRSKFLEMNLKPLILGLQTLPSICWVSFAILWFGLSQNAVIFVIVIGSAFSIAMSVNNSFKNINPLYIKAAKTMGASGVTLYTKVMMPAALPMIISGLRQGWSFAWRALMSSEMIISMVGLGQRLDTARSIRADINEIVVIMIVIIILGVLVDTCIFSTIEKKMYSKRGLIKNG